MIYFEFFLVIILGILLRTSSQNVYKSKKRKAYVVICLAMFWFVAALRNTDWVGSLHLDAAGYAYTFSRDRLLSWNSIFTVFINRYIFRTSEQDIGYFLLERFIGILTSNYNVFSLIADALFFVPFGILLYRYNERVQQIELAFIFYIALLQVYMISGGRQMFALGLDILAVLYAMDKKWRKVIVSFVLGLTIHSSSLLMILPLVLIYFDVKPKALKTLHGVSFIAFPLVFLFPNVVIRFLGNLVGMEKYAAYGSNEVAGGANTFILLMLLLSIFCYVAIRTRFLEENPVICNLYTMLPFLTFFAPLINSNGSMIRISLYVFIYLTVLLPKSIDFCFTNRSRQLVYTLIIVSLILLTVRGGVMDYHFMWEDF